MMRPRLSYANVVATLCLFLLLGGGAYAATALPRGSVGTKQLKANAVTGAKVKNQSLTGADVDARTLGQVPSAAHAGAADATAHATSADSAARAGDAGTLGGQPPAAFLGSARIPRIAYAANWKTGSPSSAVPIFSLGPLTVSAVCFSSQLGETDTFLELRATSTPGATIDRSLAVGNSANTEVVTLGETPAGLLKLTSGPEPIEGVSTAVYRDPTRTVAMTLAIRVGIDGSCRVSGTAIDAE